MNLYKIVFAHYGPKDSEYGTRCLLLAKDDEDVYNWLAGDSNELYLTWLDEEEDDDEFKERIISNQGQIDDESVDTSSMFYGVTIYGWELLKEDVKDEGLECLGDFLKRTT